MPDSMYLYSMYFGLLSTSMGTVLYFKEKYVYVCMYVCMYVYNILVHTRNLLAFLSISTKDLLRKPGLAIHAKTTTMIALLARGVEMAYE